MKPAAEWAEDPLGLTDPVALLEQVQREAVAAAAAELAAAVPALQQLPPDPALLVRVLEERVRRLVRP